MSIDAHAYSDPQNVSETSPTAARLLEMTARETDQWRAEARSEADAIVAGARNEAAELVRAAREEAEGLVAAAREEAEGLVAAARKEAAGMEKETAAARRRHEKDIAGLEQVATEHREHLRQHLTDMLGRVDADPAGETA